jgi:hypothetical protein
MSSFSLESAIKTCKVDPAWGPRVQSDRFFNPNNMVCPVWNGLDSAGRPVCPDSFVTKTAGCNSAEDRVLVENDQRPQYMEYVNLNANGFGAPLYGDTMPWNNAGCQNAELAAGRSGEFYQGSGYGGFGHQYLSTNAPRQSGTSSGCCSSVPYRQAQAQMSQTERFTQSNQHGFNSNNSRRRSGM